MTGCLGPFSSTLSRIFRLLAFISSFIILKFRTHLLVSDGVKTGCLDLVGVVMEAHVTEHHDSTQQQGSGVCHVQTSDVRGGAMNLREAGSEK